jgi:membrane-bound lytic murein transglycosylase B
VRALIVILAALAMTASRVVIATQDEIRPPFMEWLAAVRTEALERGIKPSTVDRALESVEEPLQVVLERDRTQAEKVLPLETYIAQRLTPAAIRTAREMLEKYRSLLDSISEKYGVPPPMIIAVWGSESNFGRFSGMRPTIAALATLAYDRRRSALFRKELFSALEILDRGDIELSQMRGSWAGAMGQPQFMPSSYLAYAEDFDGDGKRDIWESQADIFASIANYLKGSGWIAGKRWGREVKVTAQVAERVGADVAKRAGSCQATRDMTVALPLKKWQELGVRLPEGGALPVADQDASLVHGTSRQFLVYENYDTLLSYNCAHAYALSVALLSDRITGSAP